MLCVDVSDYHLRVCDSDHFFPVCNSVVTILSLFSNCHLFYLFSSECLSLWQVVDIDLAVSVRHWKVVKYKFIPCFKDFACCHNAYVCL